MNDYLLQKMPLKYVCKCCDFKSSKQSNYETHLLTLKHQQNDKMMTNNDKIMPENAIKFVCFCGKEYKHRQGLWGHKKKCNIKEMAPGISNTIINDEIPVTDVSNNLIIDLIKQNQEFKELIIEQNKENNKLHQQMIEYIANNMGNTNCNNTNSNNHFNLQFFLNETCKDALNIDEFVNQITLQLSDLDMMGQIGYVAGMSKIIIRNLNNMDVCKRPIHCSDLKRETLYIKDKNIWEKENGENLTIKKAIKGIECKNIRQLSQWKAENPTYEDTETSKHLEYHHILIEALGGPPLEDDNKKHEKIIRNIAKEVVINKKPL